MQTNFPQRIPPDRYLAVPISETLSHDICLPIDIWQKISDMDWTVRMRVRMLSKYHRAVKKKYHPTEQQMGNISQIVEYVGNNNANKQVSICYGRTLIIIWTLNILNIHHVEIRSPHFDHEKWDYYCRKLGYSITTHFIETSGPYDVVIGKTRIRLTYVKSIPEAEIIIPYIKMTPRMFEYSWDKLIVAKPEEIVQSLPFIKTIIFTNIKDYCSEDCSRIISLVNRKNNVNNIITIIIVTDSDSTQDQVQAKMLLYGISYTKNIHSVLQQYSPRWNREKFIEYCK